MKYILFCVKELNSFTSHPSFFLSPIVSQGLRENYLFCSLSCLVETNEKKISQPERLCLHYWKKRAHCWVKRMSTTQWEVNGQTPHHFMSEKEINSKIEKGPFNWFNWCFQRCPLSLLGGKVFKLSNEHLVGNAEQKDLTLSHSNEEHIISV